MERIVRDEKLNILNECFEDMRNSLPIKVWVNDDEKPHRIINTYQELENYFSGALPYCLTTRYEHF